MIVFTWDDRRLIVSVREEAEDYRPTENEVAFFEATNDKHPVDIFTHDFIPLYFWDGANIMPRPAEEVERDRLKLPRPESVSLHNDALEAHVAAENLVKTAETSTSHGANKIPRADAGGKLDGWAPALVNLFPAPSRVESVGVSSTTSNSYQNKLTFNMAGLVVGASYLVFGQVELKADGNSRICYARLTDAGIEYAQLANATQDYMAECVFFTFQATATTKTIALDFRSSVNGSAVSVRRAALWGKRQ